MSEKTEELEFGPYKVVDSIELGSYPSSYWFVINVFSRQMEQSCRTKESAIQWAKRLHKEDELMIAQKIDDLLVEDER